MEQTSRIGRLADQLKGLTRRIGAAGLAGYVVAVFFSGGNPVKGVWAALAAFLCLYLPGDAAARLFGLRPGESEWPHLMRILFGCGSFGVLTCFAARFSLPAVLWLSPAAGLGWLLYSLRGQDKRQAAAGLFKKANALRQDGYFLLLAAVWGMLCLVFALAISMPNAKPGAFGLTRAPSNDLLWNIGNAKSFAMGFPPQDIRFSGVRFSYHYLTELIWGGLAMGFGLDAYELIAFWAGPILLAVLLCALWSAGRVFYKGDRDKTLVFLFLLFFANCASGVFAWGKEGLGLFGNSNFLHLVTNINAQTSEVIFLCAFFILFAQAAGEKFAVSWRRVGAILCAFALCTFAKGPTAAVVMCAAVITMGFVLVFQKPHYLKALAVAAGLCGVFGAGYLLLFSSGANSSMTFGVKTVQDCFAFFYLAPISDALHLSYFGMAIICAVQWFLMQPAQFLLLLRGLPADIKGLFKLPAERLLANGCIAGGMMAYFMFWHPSYSQVYFALLAFFFSSLLAADAAFKLKHGWAKALIALVTAWAVLSTGAMAGSVALAAVEKPGSASAYVTADDKRYFEHLYRPFRPAVLDGGLYLCADQYGRFPAGAGR